MKNLLRIKHWQLFIILTSTLFISIFVAESSLKIGTFESLKLSVLIREIGLIVYFLWLLILGISLNNRPENPHKFKSGIYIAAILFCILGYSDMNLQIIFSENYFIPYYISMLSMPLTLFGLIYVFYNLPMSLKSLESNKKVGFGDCVADLFLLFAFPIGVWFTQPRINRLNLTGTTEI
jgi:hypothetical protein